jgi:phosphoribosyl 1,2-cyclic phosphate phosphodiesterase
VSGDKLRLTILGCGSSPGTPRITGDWGACDPHEPRNRRTRAAALVERIAPDGRTTRVAIDTGPDFRQQMLTVPPRPLDGVIYTHPHADHIHGIDDLRSFVLDQRRLMPIFADRSTLARLKDGFRYCFETPPGSNYPPILRAHQFEHDDDVVVEGAAGPLRLTPLPQFHGDIVSLGFRVGSIAYCSDVSGFPETTLPLLEDLACLVIDALQYRLHPSHFSLGEALEWIDRLRPARAILTHMHIPLDYRTVLTETPPRVEPAYDGMVVELPLDED